MSMALDELGLGYQNLSISGASSDVMMNKLLTHEKFNEATVISGIDLFFWDTVKHKDCSLEYIETFYSAQKYQQLFAKNLILAQVPEFHPFQKSECVSSINQWLVKSCVLPTCKLLPKTEFYTDYLQDTDYLQNDRLHPTKAGNEFLAQEICRSIP
jgi:hypothetical protein